MANWPRVRDDNGRDRDVSLPRPRQDWDIDNTRQWYVSRPRRRDQDHNPAYLSVLFFYQTNFKMYFNSARCRQLPSVLWCWWLGGRKGIRPVKNMGGWWRWALVSPDGVAPSRMVGVSASVIFPCTVKSRSFLATAHPGGPRKRAVKWLWWCCSQHTLLKVRFCNDTVLVFQLSRFTKKLLTWHRVNHSNATSNK